MTKDRITKAWLKNHLAYSWWKYLLLAALCVFCVDILFAVTAYRPPEEKKVEIYILNDYVDAQTVEQEIEPLFFARCPDQEELSVLNINLSTDDMYARMQFSTYASAKQGDLYMMPRAEMLALAGEDPEVFVDLTPYIDQGVIDLRGIDTASGVMKDAEGNEGIYAIPADSLYGLLDYGNDPAGSVLCLPAFGGNEANSARALNLLIEQYHTEMPEGYEQMRHSGQKQTSLF